MSRFTRNITPQPILPTPGLDHPRFTRLRFHANDAGASGTPGVAPAAPAAGAPVAPVVDPGAATPPAPVPTPPAPGAPAATDPATPPAPNALPTDVPSLQAMVATLRQENGAARTNAKATAAQEARDAVVQDIGKAIGLIKDGDATPDPAALTAAAQEAAARANTATVELAVFRAASDPQSETKADPVALLDSRAFLDKVKGLDPTAADFKATLDAAIKAAVAENPRLAAQAAAPTPPRRTAVGTTSGTGERPGTNQPSSLNAAVSAAYAQQ